MQYLIFSLPVATPEQQVELFQHLKDQPSHYKCLTVELVSMVTSKLQSALKVPAKVMFSIMQPSLIRPGPKLTTLDRFHCIYVYTGVWIYMKNLIYMGHPM